MTCRISSGSSRADIAVEPDESQNMTVSCRRSAASIDQRTQVRGLTASRWIGRSPDLRSPSGVASVPQWHAKLAEVALRQVG